MYAPPPPPPNPNPKTALKGAFVTVLKVVRSRALKNTSAILGMLENFVDTHVRLQYCPM